MEAMATARPDFVCKVYRMIQECPNLISWDNGRIVISSPKDLEAKLPEFFRHGKFTSFQRQLNKFGFRVEKHGGTKGACVYTRDDLTGQPIEALLGIQKRTVVYDAPSVNGALAGGLPPEWLHGGLGALYGLGAAGLLVMLFPGGATDIAPRRHLKAAGLLALAAAALWAMGRWGFIWTAPVLAALLVATLRERRPVWIAATVLAVPLGIWLAVEQLLGRTLP